MGKTRGVHETTPELRNRMVGMYEAGLGLGDIAAAVNCSQRTVKRWLNRFDKEGTVETRERCGRKRATTSEEDDAIIRLATRTPITAAKAVLPALGLTCSVDTIRERLHKAGIHNWSPSRKHMRRIPLGDGEAATIRQAVWRPTGTQLGKKKLVTKEKSNLGRRKKSNGVTSGTKKKTRSVKIRVSDAYANDGAPPGDDSERSADSCQLIQSQEDAVTVQRQKRPDLSQGKKAAPITNDGMQFGGNAPPNLVESSQQQMYRHYTDSNVAPNWPLDLVQDGHGYLQGQTYSASQEQAITPQFKNEFQEMHTQREQEQQQQRHDRQIQEEICERHQRYPMDDRVTRREELPSTESSKIARFNVYSNSSSSNDRTSEIDELSKDGSREEDGDERKKKKGGKAKGTLETSVEIRNRMIGMSEAGLSTLSIALAINRSERTVKRWLERWNKEGNVRTKERKGRRRITTKEQDEAIIAMATQHPLTAAKHVAPALGLNCSVDTVRERLHKAGIHSWKLGKKQGEGNTVGTVVHLWQPSGNRPNRPRFTSDGTNESSVEKKRAVASSNFAPKRSQRKIKSVESSKPKIGPPPPPPTSSPPPPPPPPPPAVVNNESPSPAVQFHDNGPLASYVPAPEMMQPVHNLSTVSLIPSSTGSQLPPTMGRTIHVTGPIMQQRLDCRMANNVASSHQVDPTIAYPSCMINSGNGDVDDHHATHMDQPDPLNYEPYIWSF